MKRLAGKGRKRGEPERTESKEPMQVFGVHRHALGHHPVIKSDIFDLIKCQVVAARATTDSENDVNGVAECKQCC